MEFENSVREAVKSIRKERIIGDLILKSLEDGYYSVIPDNIIMEFKKSKKKTDENVEKLVNIKNKRSLKEYISQRIDFEDMKTYDYLTLVLFIERNEINNMIQDLCFNNNISCDAFIEENYKYKLRVYLWYLNNHDIDPQEKSHYINTCFLI